MCNKYLTKFFLILILLPVPFFATADPGLESRETFLQEGDPDYGRILKYITYTENGTPRYAEAYFTEKIQAEAGRIMQTNYVNPDGTPYKYEMRFTDAYAEEWGILKSGESFDGRILKEITYTFYNGKVMSFNNEALSTVQSFVPQLLYPQNQSFLNNNPNPGSGGKIPFVTSLGYSSSYVTVPDDAEILRLNDDESLFVDRYFNSRGGLEDFARVNWYKVTALENGREVVFYFNDIIREYMGFIRGEGVYFFHFLGGVGSTPMNMVTASLPFKKPE